MPVTLRSNIAADMSPAPVAEVTRAPRYKFWPLPEEVGFYDGYAWCLNPYPTAADTIGHLRRELAGLCSRQDGWRAEEHKTNSFLLAGALLNAVDEFLQGPTLRLPRQLAANPVGRAARRACEYVHALSHPAILPRLRRWRRRFLDAFENFLLAAVVRPNEDTTSLITATNALAAALEGPLPDRLAGQQTSIPSPFRRLDLTHHDIVELGRRYIARFPDRSAPLLLVGLRTSGSYFAPLLRALFRSEGYAAVALLTLQPDKGAGPRERRDLRRLAADYYTAVIVDDPPLTAGTIFLAFDIARRAGFAPARIKALTPVLAMKRDWHKPLPEDAVVSLAPEDWRKTRMLSSGAATKYLKDYFQAGQDMCVRIGPGAEVAEINRSFKRAFDARRGTRLKHVFEVNIPRHDGQFEQRFVLAKSVGWGWLGYHAFLTAARLDGLVPPLLGLRDGVLYTEWLRQDLGATPAMMDRATAIDAAATYIAARATRLGLNANPLLGNGQQRHHNGYRLLEKALARAYGGARLASFCEARVGTLLRKQKQPRPALIDGRMQPAKWVADVNRPLKTDFEHHGLGKAALNVVDPAYDLADTILHFSLPPAEGKVLLDRYAALSGDVDVGSRLFLNKLLAGLWSMDAARAEMFGKPHMSGQIEASHQTFMRAWHFLIAEGARHAGQFCCQPELLAWRAPLVLLDIDGVIDRRLFGYPVTTPKGIEALSLLHRRGLTLAVNTARSIGEVQDYCDAYGLAGGVAEHGACLWDAVGKRERPLIGSEAARQLEKLRTRLRSFPGVFFDDRHRHSVRAFTYRSKGAGGLAGLLRPSGSFSVGDGALAPLPTLLIQQIVGELGLDKLGFHQTTIDTTITAREADKGTGLVALRDWVLTPAAETIAVGDSSADLAMFAAATRSYAPANIDCAGKARLLGCKVVGTRYQAGLLEIARLIAAARQTSPEPAKDPACMAIKADLFLHVLQASEDSWPRRLARVLLDPASYKVFVR